MQTKLLGACGVLLFGSFGMLSGVASAHQSRGTSEVLDRV